MRPLHRLPSVAIDVPGEVRKIRAAEGKGEAGNKTLGAAYKAYTGMKTLGFFHNVAEAYGNVECLKEMSLRTYDIFIADTGKGRQAFVVVPSREALEAFLDDGFVLLKIRDWLVSSYKEALISGDWDAAFAREGSPLPRGVKVVPFFKEDFADGTPGVVMVLVKV
jgi:hypothetical protein